ncbi:MAG TPA: sigma-70 family RNA polymerase sigma factor [Planctomycetaceae bacterium]|jgi:RNA polymerase sigma-70 factor (ECF subfamily)|nr:sigma-70 family RNA polymerase sigma factor [Planctomycetaceae bacterium]
MCLRENDFQPADDICAASTDSDLLSAARRMEAKAWEDLVERYSSLLTRWCRASGLSQDNAADVVQVVLAQVAIHLPQFQQDGRPASFRRWLRQVARSKIVDFQRASAKQPRAQGGSAAQAILAAIPSSADVGSETAGGPDPLLERFWKLVERLEDQVENQTWRAFWLTTVEDRTSADAAKILEMSPNSVRLAKSRVLRKLRDEAAKPEANAAEDGSLSAP